MENCLGVITMGQNDNNFGALCKKRPDAMLPFAGRYRLIDFTLSNMVNGGIDGVGIFTGNKIQSVMNHVRSGKPWGLNRNVDGLYLFPPEYDTETIYHSVGDLNELKKNQEFFLHSNAENLYFSSTNMLTNIDLAPAYNEFLKSNADITLIYKNIDQANKNYIGCHQMSLDDEKRLKQVGMYIGISEKINVYLEMFFIKKKVFFEILNQSIETGKEQYIQEAIFNSYEKYCVTCHEYKGNVNYINNIQSYYDANMRVLDREFSKDLFYTNGHIFTTVKDEPPTYYRENSSVKNSFVANGCIIDGTVENSIIFRGVNIAKGGVIRNSVIMQKTDIGENVLIENAILDKDVVVNPNVTLMGNRSIPYVVSKGEIISNEEPVSPYRVLQSLTHKCEGKTSQEVS